LNNGSNSSYIDSGSYDDSETDGGSTIAPVADNSDMWSGYEQAVDARTKAQWKKMLDNHRSEWSAKTRNGKNPTGWWDAYLTNKRIADYYRLEYPGHVVNEAFSRWYASKFGATKSKTTLTSTTTVKGAITSARLLAQKLAYLNNVSDMVALLKQYPQYAADPQVKYEFTKPAAGYGTFYENAMNEMRMEQANRQMSLYGSGDEPTSQIVIPPVDEFAIQQQLGNMQQEEQTPTVVNQFLVGKNTTDNTDWIAQLEQVTFNVRAERVEALLEEISKKMDSVNNNTTVVTTPQPTPTESPIPDQVTMLARG
jgi:hypothetical protein